LEPMQSPARSFWAEIRVCPYRSFPTEKATPISSSVPVRLTGNGHNREEAVMNHVLVSEFADQRISALKAEAAAVRLARTARAERPAPRRRHRFLLATVASSFFQR